MGKTIKQVVLGLVGFFVVAIGIGYFLGESRYFYVSIVNSGAGPVEVKAAAKSETWTVAAGEAKTVKIDGQSDKQKEQSFTVTANGKSETVSGSVVYGASYGVHYLLDVTGRSCFIAADFGALYQVKGQDAAEEEAGIKLVETITNDGKKFFEVPTLKDSKEEIVGIAQYPGEKLPERIDVSRGVKPKHVRLVHVPCEMLKDGEQLSAYLVAN
ncbi:MAG: hypothetical protein HY696_10070 [Deltaproteobacteria bacterium]|nr:hypothetical protein [Deltaproteobacteria bacterium]